MKFTIRDLFLVTMIVALVLGWWLTREGLKQQRKAGNLICLLSGYIPKVLFSSMGFPCPHFA